MSAIFVQCPCCQKDRNLVSATPILKVAQEIVEQGCAPWHWKGETQVVVDLVKRKVLQWVCNACLKQKYAIPANPSKQNFANSNPFFAYIDQKKTCQTCGNTFIFSAQEQCFWYEELKFLVVSHPTTCPACRRENREKKKSMLALQEALENLDSQDPEGLLAVADSFQRIGNNEKALLYLRRAKNLERKGKKPELFSENIELTNPGGE